jgi:hypothetical protein
MRLAQSQGLTHITFSFYFPSPPLLEDGSRIRPPKCSNLKSTWWTKSKRTTHHRQKLSNVDYSVLIYNLSRWVRVWIGKWFPKRRAQPDWGLSDDHQQLNPFGLTKVAATVKKFQSTVRHSWFIHYVAFETSTLNTSCIKVQGNT